MTMMRILSEVTYGQHLQKKRDSLQQVCYTDTFQWGLFPGSQLSFVLKISNHYTTF